MTRKRYQIQDPDDLPFGAMFAIKAATGVDVMDPPTRAHQLAAMVWLAAKTAGDTLTWEEACGYTVTDVDFPEPEDETAEAAGLDALDPDADTTERDAENPTGGSDHEPR